MKLGSLVKGLGCLAKGVVFLFLALLVFMYLSEGPFWRSKSQRLLGEKLELTERFKFDDLRKGFATEGGCFYVFSLPKEQALSDQELKSLPRYLRFAESEERFQWKDLASLTERESYVLQRCLKVRSEQWRACSLEDPQIGTILQSLETGTPRAGLLLCATYKSPYDNSEVVTDLEMYVLDLESGILIRLGWWT